MSERLSGDEPTSTDDLFSELYEDLERHAKSRMTRERANHTLSPTALVHEAWLRIRNRPAGWASKGQFYIAASEAMRRILVESARRRMRAKRGGGWVRVTLGNQDASYEVDPTDIIALEEAMKKLADESPRAARVANLSFFAGLGIKEIAPLEDVTQKTIKSDIVFFQAYLGDLLRTHEPPPVDDDE